MTTILLCDSHDEEHPLVKACLRDDLPWEVLEAKHGRGVLERLDAHSIDVLVSDARVPDMSADELLRRVRQRVPSLPIVLLTANRPDENLVRALRLGVASYVPRASVERELSRTVERILAVRRAWAVPRAPLVQSRTRTGSTFVLPSDPARFAPLVAHVQNVLGEIGTYSPGEPMRMGLALEEALWNGLIHGNLEVSSALRDESYDRYEDAIRERMAQEPFRDRSLTVDVEIALGETRITVRDEGRGFDTTSLPDPHARQNRFKVSGRGVFLMRCAFDEVRFNERGNTVTLIRRAGLS